MTSLRARLRLWAAAWLFFQVASLSAFVPGDCCSGHREAAGDAAPQSHDHAAAMHCPMRAADGTPCPMHDGGHSHGAATPAETCSMRGTCSGPLAALAALLSQHGVLARSFVLMPDRQAGVAASPARESLVGRLASPDPPPPRA